MRRLIHLPIILIIAIIMFVSNVETTVTAFCYRTFMVYFYLFLYASWTTDASYFWLSIKEGFGKYLETEIAAQFDVTSLSVFIRMNTIADEIRNHHFQVINQVPYSLGEFSRSFRHNGPQIFYSGVQDLIAPVAL